MTDAQTSKETQKRAYQYIDSLTKEARKALTQEFNQKHKGMAFGKVPDLLSQGTVDWFQKRDNHVRVTHESTTEAKNGSVRMTFKGEAKSAKFKMRLDATFSVSGSTPESPAYLKDLNFGLDTRDFY